VATLRAVEGVEMTSQQSGLVEKIAFQSGETIKKGDLMVQLSIAQDVAQLKGLKAAAKYKKAQLQRQSTLYKRRVSAKTSLDQARASYDSARADVKARQVVISQKTIRAPFSGIVGIRQIDLGQYISPGTQIVTLQSLQPLYAEFSLPQQFLPKVHKGQAVQVHVDAYPDTTFNGEITAINPKIDKGTRNFKLQATLDNDKKRLRPGMFGHAQVVLPQENQVVTLPQAAISYNPYGDTVYLVLRDGKPVMGKPGRATDADDKSGHPDAKLTVKQIFVTLGEQRGDQVAIKKGVKAGQLVVTSGQLKLKNGALIKINNSVLPANNPSPNPPEE
jgi:membrane fusion protein (multidrug efflux system)